MQLEIPFEYIDNKELLNDFKENNSYLEEFKKGNFSNLLKQTIYSNQEEIIDILLKSEDTLPEVKIAILKKMAYNIKYINKEKVINKTKEDICTHNNIIRELLSKSFQNEDRKKLKKMGLEKFWKYNNFYWKSFGGKNFQEEFEIIINNQTTKEQLKIERKNYIIKCLNYLLLLNFKDQSSILKIYTKIFPENELIETIESMKLSDDQKKLFNNL